MDNYKPCSTPFSKILHVASNSSITQIFVIIPCLEKTTSVLHRLGAITKIWVMDGIEATWTILDQEIKYGERLSKLKASKENVVMGIFGLWKMYMIDGFIYTQKKLCQKLILEFICIITIISKILFRF